MRVSYSERYRKIPRSARNFSLDVAPNQNSSASPRSTTVSRRDHPEQWDLDRFAINRALFAAPADNVDLRRGGLRWLTVQDDAITFLRESPEQTVLVHAARPPDDPRLGARRAAGRVGRNGGSEAGVVGRLRAARRPTRVRAAGSISRGRCWPCLPKAR